MMMPTTPLKEPYNLIQHLIDESEYDDDDDDLNNPLSEDNSYWQTRRKLIKYVICNRHAMTHKHVDKNPVRPITKTNPNHKPNHTDGGESGTST